MNRATPAVGSKWQRTLRPTLYYVRGIIDDQVVLRYWSPRKGWVYKIESAEVFDPTYPYVLYEPVKRQRRAGAERDGK